MVFTNHLCHLLVSRAAHSSSTIYHIIFKLAGLSDSISATTWLSITGHHRERGWITQRNKYVSISHVLTFSKALFFIHLEIDVQRTRAEQLYSDITEPV